MLYEVITVGVAMDELLGNRLEGVSMRRLGIDVEGGGVALVARADAQVDVAGLAVAARGAQLRARVESYNFV